MGNDFGWAVTQMLQGKEVRRPDWTNQSRMAIRNGCFMLPDNGYGSINHDFGRLRPAYITATDWEEYRQLPHSATPYTVNIDQAFKDVREFMTEISRRTGRWMPGMPGNFDLVRNSRIRMIFEEWNETATAIECKDEAGELDGLVDLLYVIIGAGIETETASIGYPCVINLELLSAALSMAIRVRPNDDGTPITMSIDALKQYFAKSGLPVGAAWDEVHAANMRKLDGGKYDKAKGKLCKPEGWVGPDIDGVLKRYPRKTNANK